MNVHALRRELAFATHCTSNFRSRLILFAATVYFHLCNKLPTFKRWDPAIQIDVAFLKDSYPITLRPARGDIFIFYEVLAFHAYNLPHDFVEVHEIETILDCGANIGMTSIFLAELYPNARIIAIEPHPDNFDVLLKNTQHWRQIEPIQAAVVGPPRQFVSFTTSHSAWGNRIDPSAAENESVEVPALTIEQIMSQMNIDHIDLLKVDIEGGEEDLFSRCSFLQKTDLVLIELHGEYSVARFQAAIDEAGFEAVAGGTVPGVRIVTARRRAT